MLKCPTCGKIYEDKNTSFCMSDGTALIQSDEEVPPTIFYKPPAYPSSQPSVTMQKAHPQVENLPQIQPPPQKKSNRIIYAGIGIVGLVALTVIVGLIIFIYALSIANNKNTNIVVAANKSANQSNTVTNTVNVAPSEKYKPELIMAINGANDAQSVAYSTYETDILKKYYSGEALKYTLAQAETMRKQKVYHSNKLEAQEFEYFKINDEATEAEVRVIETWSTIAYNYPSGRCLGVYPATKQPQIVHLKKGEEGWKVDSTIYDVGTRMDPQPCPKKGKN